jgi:dipeptidyl-peptidase-4
LRSGPRSFVHDLYEFDVPSRQERLLLTAEQILQGAEEELSVEEKARRERMRMTSRGITGFQLSEDGEQILVPLSGRLFVVERRTSSIKELPNEGGFPIDPKFSPDGRFVACAREGDIYVMEISSGRQTRLTTKAGPHITNGVAEFVAQEEMGRFSGFWWSPHQRA